MENWSKLASRMTCYNLRECMPNREALERRCSCETTVSPALIPIGISLAGSVCYPVGLRDDRQQYGAAGHGRVPHRSRGARSFADHAHHTDLYRAFRQCLAGRFALPGTPGFTQCDVPFAGGTAPLGLKPPV